jgi:hypothetical protein
MFPLKAPFRRQRWRAGAAEKCQNGLRGPRLGRRMPSLRIERAGAPRPRIEWNAVGS